VTDTDADTDAFPDVTAGRDLAAALGLNPDWITSVSFEPAGGGSMIVKVESTRYVDDASTFVHFLSNYRLVRIEEPTDG
jgi:hypothetical protein